MLDNELLIYKGKDYVISDRLIVHQPTLEQISEYGENKYFSMIHTLTSVGADLKWQLEDFGIDYTKISDFELFYSLLIKGLTQEQTSIIFGDLDFSKFEVYVNNLNDEICLAQEVFIEEEVKKYNKFITTFMKLFHIKPKVIKKSETVTIIIDEYTYLLIVEFLRKVHGLKRNNQIPANESTRQILIDDDREEYERNKGKEVKSQLLNLISTMVNSEGFKYNNNTVWDMKIGAFINSVKRISKIKSATMLLQSAYSGNGIDLKSIDKKQLDWLGELD